EIPSLSPTVPFRPPEVGEILFPLGVGDEWSAYVLDNYGDTRGRCCGYFHEGVDIMADEGTPQLAVVDGELTKRYEGNFWGWTLLGDDGVTYKYFHSAEDANGWELGDRVQQGDVIGFVSDSGTSVGNFHLHFEYRPGNQPADSYDKLQRVPGAIFPN
ncbi:MAG: M23 family metallopeptidase, partial [Ilumatobacter sp.]